MNGKTLFGLGIDGYVETNPNISGYITLVIKEGDATSRIRITTKGGVVIKGYMGAAGLVKLTAADLPDIARNVYLFLHNSKAATARAIAEEVVALTVVAAESKPKASSDRVNTRTDAEEFLMSIEASRGVEKEI